MADEELRAAERAWRTSRTETDAEKLIRARAKAGLGIPLEQQLDLAVMVARLTVAFRAASCGSGIAARVPPEGLTAPITWAERVAAIYKPGPHRCEPGPWHIEQMRGPSSLRGAPVLRWRRACPGSPDGPCPERRIWLPDALNGPPRGEPHEHFPGAHDPASMRVRCAYPGCRATADPAQFAMGGTDFEHIFWWEPAVEPSDPDNQPGAPCLHGVTGACRECADAVDGGHY